MSAYNSVTTIYKDQECLVESLKEMGYTEIEVHELPQNLVGYHADLRQQRAHIIIRRKHIGLSSNDIGYLRNADGTFTEIISDFDKRKHDSKWSTNLKAKYTEAVTMKTAHAKGFHFLSRRVVNGKVQLKFSDRRS